ncbi:MAG: hypothetical protein PHW33_00620 [Candidatus Portnoybacteria bacterium]|jgi:hypothetical protein|nr:hypothetical protein [Candidatus Portnoybacteria bacterium]
MKALLGKGLKVLLVLAVLMFGFSVYLFFGWLTLGLLAATTLATIILILILARLDIFFTLAEEGTAKAVMALDGFSRIIMQYRGKTINADGEVDEGREFHLFGGLRWLGIPFYHSLYEYHFRWKTLRVQSGEIIPRDEIINYILVKDDVYVAEIKNAESRGMVPLDITLLLTACCVNPYKALFKTQDWMEMIINRSEAIFREYVAQLSFEDIIKEKQKAGGEIWQKMVEAGLTSPKEKESQGLLFEEEYRTKIKGQGLFEEEYGIKIKGIEMRDVNPSGTEKNLYEQAASKKWLADREAERIKIIAQAEKDRIDTVYETIEKHKDGKAIRFMESLDNAGKNPGNWIIPFDIGQVLGKLFGSGSEKPPNQKGDNK